MLEEEQIIEKNQSKSKQGKPTITPTQKKQSQKAPLAPAKPKIRLEILLQQAATATISKNEINELFSQINKLFSMTIKFKDSYSQQHIQDIKVQAQSLGIKMGNQDLQLSFIKSNSFVSLVRAKISTIFNKFLMPTYQVSRSLSSNPNN